MPAQNAPLDPLNASIEDLLNMRVTSVSKKEQTLSKTAAAVFVIDREDIRRSGAGTIPDLLRMVPGVEVAQVESGQWAVSIRGFNSIYANKVLVLVDGRTVYQDSFSGVFWDELNIPLENIDRIEVIRGPGGTIWGANAVNGVINIITKSSAEMRGGLLVSGSGNVTKNDSLLRYGGKFTADGSYDVFARYADMSGSTFPGGSKAPDGWHHFSGGFRIDEEPDARDSVLVEGGFLSSEAGVASGVATAPPPVQFTIDNPLTDDSGDILARWSRALSNGSETFQVYDNVIRRREVGVDISDNTADAQFERHVRYGSRHDIVWGLDYRITTDRLTAATNYALRLNPPFRADNLVAVFGQDEIELTRSVSFTFGSKVEHNAYTGFEFEPSAQFTWAVSNRNSLWVSAARAVREPARTDFDAQFNQAVVTIPDLGPALLTLSGNPRLRAEHLNDYEAGYRSQIAGGLSFDAAVFLSYYRDLETVEPGAPVVAFASGQPYLVLPTQFANLGHARDYGVELFAGWSVNRHWKISPGFSFLRMKAGLDPPSQDSNLLTLPGNSPQFQPQISSLLTLRRNFDLDTSVKYVSALPAQNVPGYARVDVRLGWRPTESMELSLTGQNLTAGHHVEFVDDSGYFLTTFVRRSAFARIAWRL